MSERGTQLLQVADGQLVELIGLISTHDEAALSLPCPGREKFCDGQRTIEQIVTNLLNHQSHQLDTLRAALA